MYRKKPLYIYIEMLLFTDVQYATAILSALDEVILCIFRR